MFQRRTCNRPVIRFALAAGLLLLAGGCSKGGPTLGAPVRLDAPEKPAASYSWPYYTDLVARGDKVAAAFMTLNGKEDRHIVVRQSSDAGGSWSTPNEIDTPDYGDTISVAPRLALTGSGDELVAVWQARRNRQGRKFMLARRSEDFGRRFGPFSVLNSATQSFPPSIVAREDGAVLVAFSDERNVTRDIFVNSSSDGGATWMPQDSVVDEAKRSESMGPAPALGSGRNAYVIWEERSKDAEALLLASRSSDLGKTWAPAKRVSPEGQPASPLWPAIVESGGRLTAVWTAGLVGETTKSWLWVSSSTDGGDTWSDPSLFYEGSVQAVFHLVARGPQIYLAWSGGGTDGAVGVYFNASDDGGATWRRPIADPLRIEDKTSKKTSAGRPRLAIGADQTVAITWQEDEKRIALKVSRDAGRTWPGDSVTISSVGKGKLRFPIVAATEKFVWVLWEQWADMTGVRKTLSDVEKLTPVEIYIRRVTLP